MTHPCAAGTSLCHGILNVKRCMRQVVSLGDVPGVEFLISVNYSWQMLELYTTEEFDKWFKKIRDRRGRARIQARIDRLEMGHFGDAVSVGDGVFELRIFFGPGYRVYCAQQSSVVVILLIGGDKDSQRQDIEKAKELKLLLEVQK